MTGLHGKPGDGGLQRWRKMVSIYGKFMRINGFEAKDWGNCVREMEDWKASYLRRAQFAIQEKKFPIELGRFDSWIPDIIASIADIMTPNRDVEASAQLKQWISNFNCAIDDRLRRINEFKSKDYRRQGKVQQERYAQRRQIADPAGHPQSHRLCPGRRFTLPANGLMERRPVIAILALSEQE